MKKLFTHEELQCICRKKSCAQWSKSRKELVWTQRWWYEAVSSGNFWLECFSRVKIRWYHTTLVSWYPVFIFFRPKYLFAILTEIWPMFEKINNNREKKEKHTFQAPSGICRRHRISCPYAGALHPVKGGQDLCSLRHCRHLHHLGWKRKENNKRVLLKVGDIGCNRCPSG